MKSRALAALSLLIFVPVSAGRADPEPGAVLAYASDPGGSLDAYVVRLEKRAAPRRLTASLRDELSPAWSPDGKRLAYRVNPPRSDVGDVLAHTGQRHG